MGRDELLMMQMSGSGWLHAGGWLHVVFLAFLLALPIYRPEKIRAVSSFRAAYTFFGLSFILPSGGSVVMLYIMSTIGFDGGGLSAMQLLQFVNAAGPLLFGISVIMAMKAIVPGFTPPQSNYSPTSFDEPPPPAGGRPLGGGGTGSVSQ